MSYPTMQKIVLSERQQDYNPSDEITINVDGNDVSLLNGKNSYLRCSVRLSGNFKAQLDRSGGGGHSLLERLNIYTGDGATLLEQLDDLPIYVGVRNYFDKTEGLENMRNLLEGLPNDSGLNSPYYNGDTLGEANFTWVELCLPLYMSGVLYGDNAFPSIATGGLMLKIKLADAMKAIQSVGVNGDEVNGFVNDRTDNGGEAVLADLPCVAGFTPTGALAAGTPGVSADAPRCFEINADIAAGAGTTTITITTTTAGQPAGIAGPVTPANLLPNVNAPTNTALFPYVKGSHAFYLNDVGVVVKCGAITDITEAAGVYTLTFAAFTSTVATAANHNPAWVCVSNGNNTASYTIRDVELVCSVVQPDPSYYKSMMSRMKTGDGYNMDIKSFNLYRNNLFKGQVKTQELIPTTEYRARSLLEAQIYPVLAYNTSFYRPYNDFLAKYQYQLANRNVPQLAINTGDESSEAVNSWNADCDAERIKCLEASKVDVKSELHPAGHFVFGREVAKIGHSFNANKNEVRITQDWGIPDGAGIILPQKDKLLYTYVRHFRKLSMKPGNVVVSY